MSDMERDQEKLTLDQGSQSAADLRYLRRVLDLKQFEIARAAGLTIQDVKGAERPGSSGEIRQAVEKVLSRAAARYLKDVQDKFAPLLPQQVAGSFGDIAAHLSPLGRPSASFQELTAKAHMVLWLRNGDLEAPPSAGREAELLLSIVCDLLALSKEGASL